MIDSQVHTFLLKINNYRNLFSYILHDYLSKMTFKRQNRCHTHEQIFSESIFVAWIRSDGNNLFNTFEKIFQNSLYGNLDQEEVSLVSLLEYYVTVHFLCKHDRHILIWLKQRSISNQCFILAYFPTCH